MRRFSENTTSWEEQSAMKEFIAKHRNEIAGVLSGFDRLIFRGTLRSLAHVAGMQTYLAMNKILLKDFARHVQHISQRLKEASLARARALGRPVQYLVSGRVKKEEVARRMAAEQGVGRGLIGVLSCVELCRSFEVYRNAQSRQLELVPRWRKCLFLYHYWMHPRWGFMHARIQTWFPFPIQIGLNGREWLGQQMQAAGLEFVRQGNCFPWVQDWSRAQQLLDQQLRVNWPSLLEEVAQQLNPIQEVLFGTYQARYYWTTYQSEWASDVVFRRAATLRRLYPRLVHHGLTALGSTDVLRFLGRRIPASGEVPKHFQGEVLSELKQREEGVRIKHTVNGNSVKLYDKAFTAVGSVLRAEATLQNTDDLRVYRPREGDPQGVLAWRRMRRGIADLHRRAQISQQATERYLDALAEVDEDTTLEELVGRLGQRRKWKGRSVRALRPWAEDHPWLQAVSRGEFTLQGFRNRDLQGIFFTQTPANQQEARRRRGWVGRRLRLLRAHGLIRKISGTHRYQLTPGGRKAITALLTALHATVRQLTPIAA
jgi:hypothetical protein